MIEMENQFKHQHMTKGKSIPINNIFIFSKLMVIHNNVNIDYWHFEEHD